MLSSNGMSFLLVIARSHEMIWYKLLSVEEKRVSVHSNDKWVRTSCTPDENDHSHVCSNSANASCTETSTEVVHDHSQFFVNTCPRRLSLGSNSCSATESKSMPGQLNVKYSPFRRARS